MNASENLEQAGQQPDAAADPRVPLGRRGEAFAAHFLTDLGYTIIDRNWRSGRAGEIDIIARDSETLVFIEVKTRASDRHGTPFDAIDARKMRQLRALAGQWLEVNNGWPGLVRIDAIGVRAYRDGLQVEHRRGVR
ncbi:YraN family protein [Pseudoclavibacter sp. 13-3]|uniref:YraN family protein n=1 Tax=Pseudoclavibacter sp. 13-3 TaxID=2901228 RepID=UPI001E62012E|nr:YraN family protein [Pseudoclavibacter sp. 13-3]MCD7100885.1 YraN family protein [Pseudoclavibacter sp. 13-3]